MPGIKPYRSDDTDVLKLKTSQCSVTRIESIQQMSSLDLSNLIKVLEMYEICEECVKDSVENEDSLVFVLTDRSAYHPRHVSLALLTRIRTNKELKLNYLVTDPRYSGSGAGTFMLDNIYTFANIDNEIESITLEDVSTTAREMPFYEENKGQLPDYLKKEIFVNPKYTELDRGIVNIREGEIVNKSERSVGFYERWMMKRDRSGLSNVVGDSRVGFKKHVSIFTSEKQPPLQNKAYDSNSLHLLSRFTFSKLQVDVSSEVTPGDIPTPN